MPDGHPPIHTGRETVRACARVYGGGVASFRNEVGGAGQRWSWRRRHARRRQRPLFAARRRARPRLAARRMRHSQHGRTRRCGCGAAGGAHGRDRRASRRRALDRARPEAFLIPEPPAPTGALQDWSHAPPAEVSRATCSRSSRPPTANRHPRSLAAAGQILPGSGRPARVQAATAPIASAPVAPMDDHGGLRPAKSMNDHSQLWPVPPADDGSHPRTVVPVANHGRARPVEPTDGHGRPWPVMPPDDGSRARPVGPVANHSRARPVEPVDGLGRPWPGLPMDDGSRMWPLLPEKHHGRLHEGSCQAPREATRSSGPRDSRHRLRHIGGSLAPRGTLPPLPRRPDRAGRSRRVARTRGEHRFCPPEFRPPLPGETCERTQHFGDPTSSSVSLPRTVSGITWMLGHGDRPGLPGRDARRPEAAPIRSALSMSPAMSMTAKSVAARKSTTTTSQPRRLAW